MIRMTGNEALDIAKRINSNANYVLRGVGDTWHVYALPRAGRPPRYLGLLLVEFRLDTTNAD